MQRRYYAAHSCLYEIAFIFAVEKEERINTKIDGKNKRRTEIKYFNSRAFVFLFLRVCFCPAIYLQRPNIFFYSGAF